ncbi:MAG TPA: acyl-protein synthetase [Fibrobacteres bacterium]|jgi:hypothetical protein|nr:acyl-protein synthetase [Fibrobacterota bacterium]
MRWQDFNRDESTFESPTWHVEALKHTEGMVREGKAKFVNWETAKKNLRQQLLRHSPKK